MMTWRWSNGLLVLTAGLMWVMVVAGSPGGVMTPPNGVGSGQSLQEMFEHCCREGEQWARSHDEGGLHPDDGHGACDRFPSPSGISNDLLKRDKEECRLGSIAGQAGGDCGANPEQGHSEVKVACQKDSRIFKSCCQGCKMGNALRRQREGRGSLLGCGAVASRLSGHFKESFLECCRGGGQTPGEEEGPLPQSGTGEGGSNNPCPLGYVHNTNLNVCDDLDECLDDGNHDCDASRGEVCVNTIGAYVCSPSDKVAKGPAPGTTQCGPGYRFYLVSCIDVDECSEKSHNCSRQETCVNIEGGFRCHDQANGGIMPPGCPSGFFRMATGECQDLDECLLDTHDCQFTQRCVNIPGSFQCVRTVTCGTGYTLDHTSGTCEDIDECALGKHDCRSMGASYQCRNTRGSFRCEKVRCPFGQLLNEAAGRCEAVVCQDGFRPGLNGACLDIDECRLPKAACRPSETCENTQGSFSCLSRCGPGFRLDLTLKKCVDIDECDPSAGSSTASCYGGKSCVNTMGSYRCECPLGYEDIKGKCQDIDECRKNPFVVCGVDSECRNSLGSYRCVCKPGFRHRHTPEDPAPQGRPTLQGAVTPNRPSCVDINECEETPQLCQQRCTNLWGSYKCHCRPGFRLSADGRTCADVDECEEHGAPNTVMLSSQGRGGFLCLGHCVNEPGSFRCTCPQGYVLSSNLRSCDDVNECQDETTSPCGGSGYCFNIRGGFKCADVSCPPDYEPEPGRKHRCRLNSEARRCQHTDLECLRRPLSVSYNFITLVSNLTVQSQGGIDLFTMQSSSTGHSVTTKFTLRFLNTRAAKDVVRADESSFALKTPRPHHSILSAVRQLEGPQDIAVELTMELYQQGRFRASALANILIYVSPYEF